MFWLTFLDKKNHVYSPILMLFHTSYQWYRQTQQNKRYKLQLN